MSQPAAETDLVGKAWLLAPHTALDIVATGTRRCMGTWIEIRCENRSEPSADGDGAVSGQRCYSHDNRGPMGLSEDTHSSILVTLRGMAREAREGGWVKTQDGWVCPYCIKRLN